MKKNLTIAVLVLIFLTSGNVFAQYSPVSSFQISQMVSMACVFEKTISKQAECSIYIYNNEEIEKAIKSFEGQKLGNATLSSLTAGDIIPTSKPDIVIIGNKKNYKEILAYCDENDILALTNIPTLVKKGVSLGMGVDNAGQAKLLINPKGVANQGRNFNPAIMKMAKIFK